MGFFFVFMRREAPREVEPKWFSSFEWNVVVLDPLSIFITLSPAESLSLLVLLTIVYSRGSDGKSKFLSFHKKEEMKSNQPVGTPILATTV